MILEKVVVGPIEVNCYIVALHAQGPAVVIDPGDDRQKIKRVLEKHQLTCAAVINTHGHFDHIGCDDAFGVNVYIHVQDQPMLSDPRKNFAVCMGSLVKVKSPVVTLTDGQMINLAGIEFKVLHTPGHSSGGICLLMVSPHNDIVFTGDTLFCQSVGRSDLGGDAGLLLKSIREKLLVLPDKTLVYPGHGPASTIKDERLHNPYLNEGTD